MGQPGSPLLCMSRIGALLCMASAAAFGAMGIFGKLAYEEGATPGTVLAIRFLIAAAVLWGFVLVSGRLAEFRAFSARDLRLGFLLGALGYSAQSASYFVALGRIDASILTLLLYTFPAIVAGASVALRREPARVRTGAGIALSFAGITLVATGSGAGTLDALGVALGLTTSAVYAIYILSSEGVAQRLTPLALTTLVCTGAAVTLTVGSVASGSVHLSAVSATGYLWIAGISLVSTIAAITLFFAGLPRVGPTAASILSTLEPIVAVVLAWIVLDESLGAAKIAGAALVLVALLVIRSQSGPERADQLVAQESAPA